jgi:Holliday junction resolvase RusA-like endonuclease
MFIFELHGKPIAQKQTRFTCQCGKGRCYDPSSKDKEHIQWQLKPFAPEVPISGPVEVTMVFFIPIPSGVSKAVKAQMINRVILPDKRPDEDNLAYLISNAMKNIVYDDDKRVCAKHVYKFYGPVAKTVIRVRPILQAEPLGYRDADEF